MGEGVEGTRSPRPSLQGQRLLVLGSVIDPGWGPFSCCEKQEMEAVGHSALRHQSGGGGRRPRADTASEGSFLFGSLQRVWEAAWLGGFLGAALCLPSTLLPGPRKAQWVAGTSPVPHRQ